MSYSGIERRRDWRLFLDKLGLCQLRQQLPIHPHHDLKK